MSIYFTSDWHLGHTNILKYSNRPFQSIEEMNETIIGNYNSVVNSGDTVIFVGDIFFCDNKTAKSLFSRLKGKKILVRGNHDLKPNAMFNIGFDFVCENMKIKVGKSEINISHYPYKRTPWNHYIKLLFNKKYRYKSVAYRRRLKYSGEWLIHGHTHSTEKVRNREINVCVEAWNYMPVPITEISKIIDTQRSL